MNNMKKRCIGAAAVIASAIALGCTGAVSAYAEELPAYSSGSETAVEAAEADVPEEETAAAENAEEGIDEDEDAAASYTFEINSSGVLTKFIGTETDTDIVIPSSIGNTTVTGLGDNLFRSNAYIESVTIPNTVKTIGTRAFYGTKALKSIIIPESVTSVGDYCFESSGVQTVVYNAPVKVGYMMFSQCKSLSSVTLANGVTAIDYRGFYDCDALTAITIPGTCKTIGEDAFRACDKLATLKLNEGLESIGTRAFQSMPALTDVTIPSTVNKVGDYVFEFSGLKTLNFKASTNVGYMMFSQCQSLSSVTLANGVTSIDYRGFYDCNALTAITIPGTCKTIGEDAFRSCEKLATLKLNEGLESIGTRAFQSMPALTDVTIPSTVNKVGDYVFEFSGLKTLNFKASTKVGYMMFSQCQSLSSVTLANGVTAIGYRGFYDCDALTAITIPGTCKTIDEDAFRGCGNLETVTLGNGIEKIGVRAFNWDGSLKSITIPSSVTSIGNYAFENTGITSANINGNDLVIGYDAFLDNKNLIRVTFGSGVKTIGEEAFYGCNYMSSLTFQPGVQTIGEKAFYNCSALTMLKLPESVTTIGNSAFAGCNNIASISLPSTLTSVGTYAFSNNTKLAKITLPQNLGAISDYMFNGCVTLQVITIPGNIKTVRPYAFNGCSGLMRVTVENGVETIGEYAFNKCYKVTAMTLPDSVTSIGEGAYKNTSLSSIDLGKGLKTIGASAFQGRSGITDITLPAALVSIGNYAFADCISLSSITIPDNVTSVGSYAFSGCTSAKAIKLGSSVETIGNYAFSNCSAYTSLVIPDSVTSVGYDAFMKNTSLASVTVGNGLENISSEMFYNCSKLENVKLGSNIGIIYGSAFSGCTSLEKLVLPDSVYELKSYAFSNCTALYDVTFGYYMTSVPNYVFNSCKNIRNLRLTNSIASLGETAMKESPYLTDIYFDGTKDEWQTILDINPNAYITKNSANFNVHCTDGVIKGTNVVKLSSIEIKAPAKTEYEYGEALDLTGGTITARYSDTTSTTFSMTSSLVSGYSKTTPGTQTVKVTYGGKSATFTVTVNGSAVVADPPLVKATAGDGSVTLTWNAVDGATKYYVSQVNSDGTFTTISKALTATTITVDDLKNGTTYTFLVQAYVDGKWTSSDSKYYVSATPKAAVVPPAVTAKAGDKSVTLTWSAVDGATKYYVSQVNSDGTYTTISKALTATTITVDGLKNGTEYTFLVQAYVDGKWTSSSSKYYVTATPKAAVVPPAVTAKAGDKCVTLTWDAVDGATKYYVSQVNSDGTYTTISKALTATTITVDGLKNGTAYTFLVQAYVDGKWTSSSSKYYVSATPKAAVVPPAVTAKAGDKCVTLTWNAVDGATKYYVSQVNDDGTYTTISKALTATTITVDGLKNGTEYTFLVQAYVNSKWTSSSSKYYVSATPKAAVVPPAVTAKAGDKCVTLTWSAVDGATKYYVSQVNSDGTYTTISKALKDTTITVDGLKNGTEYTFLVQAYVNSKWTSSSKKYYVTATPKAAAPAVTAKAGNKCVTLTWNAVDGATKYYVSQVNSDGTYTTINKALKDTTITVDGLKNGTTYTFLVQAYANGKWTSSSSKYYVSATPAVPKG